MKALLLIGFGTSSIPEVAAAPERARWEVAWRETYGHARHALARAEAHLTSWAVVLPLEVLLAGAKDRPSPIRELWWRLVAEIEACPAIAWWTETELPDPRPARAVQGELFARAFASPPPVEDEPEEELEDEDVDEGQDDDDLKEACSLLAAKKGLTMTGDVSISHTPAGSDRPWDPASTSISFDVEIPEVE